MAQPSTKESESEGEDRISQSVKRRKREVAQASTPVQKYKVQTASGLVTTHNYPHSTLPSCLPSSLPPSPFPQSQPSESEGEDRTSRSGVRRKREAAQASTLFKKHKVQNARNITHNITHITPSFSPPFSQCQSSESQGKDRTSQSVERRKREVAQPSTPVNMHKVQNAPGLFATYNITHIPLSLTHSLTLCMCTWWSWECL